MKELIQKVGKLVRVPLRAQVGNMGRIDNRR